MREEVTREGADAETIKIYDSFGVGGECWYVRQPVRQSASVCMEDRKGSSIIDRAAKACNEESVKEKVINHTTQA